MDLFIFLTEVEEDVLFFEEERLAWFFDVFSKTKNALLIHSNSFKLFLLFGLFHIIILFLLFLLFRVFGLFV